jgi:hypothetical protein
MTISKNAIIAILLAAVIAVGGGAWYYSSRIRHADIEKVLSNPRAFEGKTVTIEGEVTDRTGFFVVLKFFKVKDKTGEITVVTTRTLPAIKSTVRVKGRVDEVFAVGDHKFVVLNEESIEEKAAAAAHKK